MRLRAVPTIAAALLVAACTATPPVPEASTPQPTTTAPSAPAPSPEPEPEPELEPEPEPQTPLVLAVHHSRGTSSIPADLARRLVAGEVAQWSELAMPGAAVGFATGAPEAQLQAVIDDASLLAVLPATAVDERVRVLRVDGVDPLREPERYLLLTDSAVEQAPVTTLTVVGDIMLGRRVGEQYAGNLDAVFAPFAERLAAADLTVGNMESTLSRDGSPTQGGDSFGADPAALDALSAAGFDAVTLANNHLGDYGEAAMLETFRLIDDSDIARFGAGVDLAEASQPWIATTDGGVRIAFIGTESIGETPAATATSPGTNRLNMPPRTPPLDEAALSRITDEIRQTGDLADVVIVMPHWGTQYVYEPEPIQREVAALFADAGADLVLGGHPHQVQGWEDIGDTTVVYSLPNFVFDMTFSRQVQEGIFLEIVLWGDTVKAVEPVAYVIREAVPQPADPGDAARILAEMRLSGRGAYVDAFARDE